MRKILFLFFASIICFTTQAQVTLWDELARTAVQDSAFSASSNPSGVISNEALYIPESLDMNVDSLLSIWHFNYYTNKHEKKGNSYNPVISDSVYMDRIRRLPRVIPLTYNETVRSCIDLYADRRRGLMEYILGWSDFYFPMIEQTLDKYDLPIELKYLAVVESSLNPTALSRMGASGLWQFMLPTGKVYGLEINSLVDERRDPAKATEAACKYFKDMYAIYNDWDLVIASYNCGPGNVNKAIKRAKGKTNFWEIYQYLPRETRMYVPLFIAVNYVMSYYHEHNLYPIEANLPFSTDTVMINKQIHFDQISDILKIDKEQLRALNPQYKRDIIPGYSKSYPLLLPSVYAYGFAEFQDTIASHRNDEFFAKHTQPDSQKEKIRYKVKRKESLLTIANRYGVTASEVRKWNGLKSNKVAAGRMLTLYVNNGGYSLASNTTSKETAEPTTKKAKKSESDSKSSDPSSKDTRKNSSPYISYKVRSGDSFYSISKNYPGVTAKDLMKVNNVNNTSLKVGQVIKIPQV